MKIKFFIFLCNEHVFTRVNSEEFKILKIDNLDHFNIKLVHV